MDESKPAPRERAGSRLNFFLTAQLERDGRAPLTVRVRNLSTGGMMVETDDELVPDTRLIAEIRGIGRVAGSVAWRAGNRAGIGFAHTVDPELARRPVGASAQPDRSYAKPIIVAERNFSDAAKAAPKGRVD